MNQARLCKSLEKRYNPRRIETSLVPQVEEKIGRGTQEPLYLHVNGVMISGTSADASECNLCRHWPVIYRSASGMTCAFLCFLRGANSVWRLLSIVRMSSVFVAVTLSSPAIL